MGGYEAVMLQGLVSLTIGPKMEIIALWQHFKWQMTVIQDSVTVTISLKCQIAIIIIKLYVVQTLY